MLDRKQNAAAVRCSEHPTTCICDSTTYTVAYSNAFVIIFFQEYFFKCVLCVVWYHTHNILFMDRSEGGLSALT